MPESSSPDKWQEPERRDKRSGDIVYEVINYGRDANVRFYGPTAKDDAEKFVCLMNTRSPSPVAEGDVDAKHELADFLRQQRMLGDLSEPAFNLSWNALFAPLPGDDLAGMVLPQEVKFKGITFAKGVTLTTLIMAAARWREGYLAHGAAAPVKTLREGE